MIDTEGRVYWKVYHNCFSILLHCSLSYSLHAHQLKKEGSEIHSNQCSTGIHPTEIVPVRKKKNDRDMCVVHFVTTRSQVLSHCMVLWASLLASRLPKSYKWNLETHKRIVSVLKMLICVQFSRIWPVTLTLQCHSENKLSHLLSFYSYKIKRMINSKWWERIGVTIYRVIWMIKGWFTTLFHTPIWSMRAFRKVSIPEQSSVCG